MTLKTIYTTLLFCLAQGSLLSYAQYDDISERLSERIEDLSEETDFMNEYIVEEIMEDYRDAFLDSLSGLSPQERNLLKETRKEKKNEIRFLSSWAPSAKEEDYAGSPLRMMERYVHLSDEISFGAVTEKDPGERAGDYVSAHFQYRGRGFLKNVTIGDYRLSAGKGLAVNQGFSAGKGVMMQSLFTSPSKIKAHKSASEYAFFRGVASDVGMGPFNLTMFFSSRNLDASVASQDSAGNVLEVATIQTSGMHRTETEISRKGNLREMVAGAFLGYRYRRLNIGINYIANKFSHPLNPPLKPYNVNYHRGDGTGILSMDFSLVMGNSQFSGELAQSDREYAALLAYRGNISSGMTLSMVYRCFSPEYTSFHGNAFGNSSVRNEEGFFAALNWTIKSNLKLYAHIDTWRSIWLEYGKDYPTFSREECFSIDYRPLSALKFNMMFRSKADSRQLTLKTEYAPAENISLKLSLAGRKVGEDKGFYMAQDMKWKYRDKWSLYLRAGWFNTPSYQCRLSLYENDLYQSFNFVSLYGSGLRGVVMIGRQVSHSVKLQAKYSCTLKEEISSQYRVQIMWNF